MFKIKIFGKVQGVSYRVWLKKTAESMSIDGYVCNNKDGSVDAFLTCNKNELKKLISLCYKGPKLSKVSKIEYCYLSDNFSKNIQKGFFIKY